MSEQAQMTDWGRNLHRELRPFLVCEKPQPDEAKNILRLMVEGGQKEFPMQGEQPRYSVVVDDVTIRSLKGVTFTMQLEKDRICEESGVPPEEIEVALLLKDFKTRNVLNLARWSLSSAPREFEVPQEQLSQVSLSDSFEISVIGYLKDTVKHRLGLASQKGSVLARCDLTVSVENEIGPDFDVTTISPEDMERAGCGRDTLFMLEIVDEDFSKPPKEVFSVKVNEIAAEKLKQVQGGNSFGSAFYRHMTSDILFQIAQKVLTREIDPNWPDQSLGKGLIRYLEKNTGISVEKLQAYAKDDVAMLQSILQSAVGLSTCVQNANLGRV